MTSLDGPVPTLVEAVNHTWNYKVYLLQLYLKLSNIFIVIKPEKPNTCIKTTPEIINSLYYNYNYNYQTLLLQPKLKLSNTFTATTPEISKYLYYKSLHNFYSNNFISGNQMDLLT